MTDYIIPCETIARFAPIAQSAHADVDAQFKTLRIDNGVLVASNRRILVAEHIGGVHGIAHLIIDPALVENCRKEAPFASKLTVTVVEALRFATAKTTLGYSHPGNALLWSDTPTTFNNWRDVAAKCKSPAKASRGGMFWGADDIALMAASSPSGRLVFEELIDTHGRPTVVRDINDYNWFGLFTPFSSGEHYTPATLPSWVV